MKESELDDCAEEESDCDNCEQDEIDAAFSSTCHLLNEHLVGKDKYVLNVTATLETEPNVAVALSDGTVVVCKFGNNQIANTNCLDTNSAPITGIKFGLNNNNLVYVGTNECVNVWDLRTDKPPIIKFKDTTVINRNKTKPLTCFDVAGNNQILCAGTELYEGDAYMLFWDVRQQKLLGGYWESHTDDITQLKFSPRDNDHLVSGSTDGLINLYDLSQQTETDALVDSLNTESSVEKLMLYEMNGKEFIFASTHTHEVQLWKAEDTQPYVHFTREALAKGIKRKSLNNCYVTGAHMINKTDLMLLLGSSTQNEDCFRSVSVKNKKLQPEYNFTRNKQLVRCSWYNVNTNVLVTGGEKGILNVWKLN